MNFEFGKIVWVDDSESISHGKRFMMVRKKDDYISGHVEDGLVFTIHKDNLSETPPKKRVKKTVYVGIGGWIDSENGFVVSLGRTSKSEVSNFFPQIISGDIWVEE